MKKIIVTILLLVAFVQVGISQLTSIPALTDQAIAAYKQKDFDQAKDLINQSIKSVDGEKDAYTWHFRGYVYRYFFDESANRTAQDLNRKEVMQSFNNSMKLDTDGTFKKANKDGIRAISNSYWNEAVVVINEKDKAKLGTAEDLFTQFKKVRTDIEDTSNLDQYTINFYKAFASANRKLIDAERAQKHTIDTYQTEFDRVIYSYEKVLKINPEDYASNYNLSINLYNEGAYIIENLAFDADLMIIMATQERAAEIFTKALPYATKADNIRPNRIETIKALRAIYLALNNYEKFDHYNKMVKEIKGSDNMSEIDSKDKFEKIRKSLEGMKNATKRQGVDE